jgi:hypothetical protein
MLSELIILRRVYALGRRIEAAYEYGSYGYPAYTKLAQLVLSDPSSFVTALSITLRECLRRTRCFALVWGTNMACLHQ